MLVGILLFGAVAVGAVRAGWPEALVSRLMRSRQATRVREIEQELARQAAVTPFEGQMSFLPRGVGVALDGSRRLLFLAVREGGRLRSAILPFTALHEVNAGAMRVSGLYDYYVDLTVLDGRKPFWRIVCGENPALADEIRQVLKTIRP